MVSAQVPAAGIRIEVRNAPKPISPDLFGAFFEDLNFAADGGLYAELVQNRSFEYSAADNKEWNSLTSWQLIERDGGKGAVTVESEKPVHPNNPHYARLGVSSLGGGVGLSNSGYDGIVLKSGEAYDVSLHARLSSAGHQKLAIQLETEDGAALGETSIEVQSTEWTRHTATLRATADAKQGRLVILAGATGSIDLDVISLFPQKTFRNRRNGLRADLAQAIADFKPRFVRFPGGCLAHGDGLDNMYRWKETIGPIETRKAQRNIWRYHQSLGLGYFEYFQFCQDIGAKPLPVVPAGVCCQNSGAAKTGKWGQGQQGLPMDQMPAYIQDVLDLIEYANGPATSTWGAKRAAAGHPEPFNLKYLGVGNEDHITPVFEERFKMIHDAIKAKHPEITVIGTVGPAHSGRDYDAGWAFCRAEKLEMVDEHYYVAPDWFWDNLGYYDKYDRTGAKVYLGEYAAHDKDRKSTLRSALAEAAYMTSLERNGDVVLFASYAPLLGKHRRTQWRPDLIYFDNSTISPTINYEVQKLFSLNAGDALLPLTIQDEAATRSADGKTQLAASCVRDSASGDLILKLVSRSNTPIRAQLDLSGLLDAPSPASCTVLSGDASAENVFGQPPVVLPATSSLQVAPTTSYDLPPNSLSVIRVRTKA